MGRLRETGFGKILAFAGWGFLLVADGLFLPSAHAAIPASERAVLLNLYADTVGDAWADTTGWNGPPGTECSWFGITCDASQSTITSIDLDNNLLRGSLPSIDALTHLQYFNVGNDGVRDPHFPNLVSGQFPPLDGLNELQIFIANNQNLTGGIPSLAGLTSLTRFEVPHNRLTGPIPALSGLAKLTYFNASYNQLTGPIPDLSDLANLSLFRVGVNQLGGGIPDLSRFSGLTVFDVTANKLTGSIPALTGLNQLKWFFVDYNQLTGSIPSLAGLAGLQALAVSDNHLTGSIPDLSGLQQLGSQLGFFYIDANQLSGTVPAPPHALNAYSASLCPNQLTPAADPPSAIDLAWNTATGVTPWSQRCSQTPAVTFTADSTDVNHSVVGQPVTFSASVYGGLSPSGTVTFSMPPTVLCANVPLIDQTASCTYSGFAAGTSNLITAAYSGDALNAASSDSYTVDQVVWYAIDQTTNANPSQQGQPIDWLATVAGAASTDTITFTDGIVPVCSRVPVAMVGGTALAHCITTFNRLGDHSLKVIDNEAALGGGSDYPFVQTVVAATGFDADQFALTGSWFNPATSGQGLEVEIFPDLHGAGIGILFAGWFTYDASGNEQWVTLQGNLSSSHSSTYSLDIANSTGGVFNVPSQVSTVADGSATLTFYDCTHAALAYHFADGRSGTIPYVRLTVPSACSSAVPAVAPAQAPANYNDVLHSGAWFNPATSGQGLVLEIVPETGSFFAAWYTYAPQSQGLIGSTAQRWFTIQGSYAPGDLDYSNLPIYVTTGGIFNVPSAITYLQAGTANIDFTSCNTMTLQYTFTQGEYSGLSGTIDEQTIVPLSGCQ